MHFHPPDGHEFQESEKSTSLFGEKAYRMAIPAQQFSLRVFDSFGKVYESIGSSSNLRRSRQTAFHVQISFSLYFSK